MTDRIMVGIASIPERTVSLERTLASLAPQVDKIALSLNGHHTVPAYIARFDNVEATVRAQNGGDAEKFAAVDEWDGYVVTCDDDLLYPADYVQRLLNGIDRYGRQTIVGFHGGKTLGFNGAALAATHKRIRCLGSLDADDTDVNVLGTGALAYHTSGVPIWRDIFRSPNMADVHLACHAHRFGIPMAALAHDAGWLTDICPPGPNIYESNKKRDGSMRDTRDAREVEMGRVDWAETPRRPRVHVSIATCERPHLLRDLVGDLERETAWLDLNVAVYEDPGAADYRTARAETLLHGWQWHRFPQRLGKEGHWQLVERELQACAASNAEWFVFLPDDVRLVDHALVRAIDTWHLLADPATLTLWRLKDHEGRPNWTGLPPVHHGHAWEVFHVDGIYLCRRNTLEALDFRCPRPRPRRRRQPTSSGVGRAMSLHLHAAGKRMYRVNKTLAVPVPNQPSVMNPDAQDRRYPDVAL